VSSRTVLFRSVDLQAPLGVRWTRDHGCCRDEVGGTSVADVNRIRNVARHVKREVDAGNKVAVVVSAMAGTTNQLVSWVNEGLPQL
jgi:hypothetical protein